MRSHENPLLIPSLPRSSISGMEVRAEHLFESSVGLIQLHQSIKCLKRSPSNAQRMTHVAVPGQGILISNVEM